MPIEEEEDSPVWENGEQVTVTHRFHGGYNNISTSIGLLHRGMIRVDSQGYFYKLLSAVSQHTKAGHGTLHTVEECMSGDTPPDRFEITPVELGLSIIKHPRYWRAFVGAGYGSAEEATNQMVIRLLQDYFENTTAAYRDAITEILAASMGNVPGTGTQPPTGSMNGDTWKWTDDTMRVAGTDMAKAAALEIIQKYWRGEEVPSVVGFQLSWTEFSWTPFPLNPGGYIQDPIVEGGLPSFLWDVKFPPDEGDAGKFDIFVLMCSLNPQSYSGTGMSSGSTMISWRREADREVRERTFFGVEHRWVGSPVGHWDEQALTQTTVPLQSRKTSCRRNLPAGLWPGPTTLLDMHTSGSIPQHVIRRFGESSALRSPRDSDDISRQHLKLDPMARQVEALTIEVKKLREDLNRLRLRKGGDVSSVSPCPMA